MSWGGKSSHLSISTSRREIKVSRGMPAMWQVEFIFIGSLPEILLPLKKWQSCGDSLYKNLYYSLPITLMVGMMQHSEMILVLDFGSQYSQLIARRVRELGVYSELHAFDYPIQKIRTLNPKGMIFSGGPSSVYEPGAPHSSPELFSLNIPILGICYGLQMIAYQLGGRVDTSAK